MTETRKLSPDEERAQIRRDNAFRDLASIVNKIQGPMLAVVETDLMMNHMPHPIPVKVILPTHPLDMAQMVAQLMHKTKQLEIVCNVLTTMLLEKNMLDVRDYHDRCALDAEETSKLMNRGLLSQGAAAGSIIRRQ